MQWTRRLVSLRLLAWTAVYALGAVLIATHAGELRRSFDVLATGKWHYVAFSIVAEAAFIVVQAWFGKALYRALGMSEGLLRLGLLAMASIFINAMVRSGGFAGISIFVEDAARRGLPAAKAAVAFLIRNLLVNVVNLAIAITGLVYLSIQGTLNAYQVGGAAFLLAAIVATTAVMLAAAQRPHTTTAVVQALVRGVNWLGRALAKKPVIQPERLVTPVAQFLDAVTVARRDWRKFFGPFLLACLVKVLDILDLYLLFLAFHGPVPLAAVVAGYGISFLGGLVAPTPGGLVIVEASMAAVFTAALDMPLETAIVIVLAFRLIDFWLPLALGAVSLRILHATR